MLLLFSSVVSGTGDTVRKGNFPWTPQIKIIVKQNPSTSSVSCCYFNGQTFCEGISSVLKFKEGGFIRCPRELKLHNLNSSNM